MKPFLRKCILAIKHKRTLWNLVKYKCQFKAKIIPQYPVLINLYITEECNARCKMCLFAESRMKHLKTVKGKDLDTMRLIEIINEGRKYQPMYYITGGEPLLYENLFYVIRAIKKNRSIVGLTSNGIKLNEFYKDIVNEGLDYISLSFDGSTSEAHDNNRNVPGGFEKLTSGVENLIKYRGKRLFPNIKINTVIRRENIDDLVATYRLAESLGVDSFQLQHYVFYNETIEKLAQEESRKYNVGDEVLGDKINRQAYMNPKDTNKLEEAIKEIRSLAKRSKIQFLIDHDGEDLYKYYAGKMHSKDSWCYEVFRIVNIRQSGQVEVCQGIVIGNIYEKNLIDIWRGKEHQKVMEHFLENRCSVACYRCCSLNIKYNSNNNLKD